MAQDFGWQPAASAGQLAAGIAWEKRKAEYASMAKADADRAAAAQAEAKAAQDAQAAKAREDAAAAGRQQEQRLAEIQRQAPGSRPDANQQYLQDMGLARLLPEAKRGPAQPVQPDRSGTPLVNPGSFGPIEYGISQRPGQLTQGQQANPMGLFQPGVSDRSGTPLVNPGSFGPIEYGISQRPGQLTQAQQMRGAGLQEGDRAGAQGNGPTPSFGAPDKNWPLKGMGLVTMGVSHPGGGFHLNPGVRITQTWRFPENPDVDDVWKMVDDITGGCEELAKKDGATINAAMIALTGLLHAVGRFTYGEKMSGPILACLVMLLRALFTQTGKIEVTKNEDPMLRRLLYDALKDDSDRALERYVQMESEVGLTTAVYEGLDWITVSVPESPIFDSLYDRLQALKTAIEESERVAELTRARNEARATSQKLHDFMKALPADELGSILDPADPDLEGMFPVRTVFGEAIDL